MRICLVGLGKTGREVAAVLLAQENIKLVSVVCSPGSKKDGQDLGEVINCRNTGIIIGTADKLEDIIFKTRPDVAIDFSRADATIRNARIFSRMKVNMVIATTGFSKIEMKRLYVLSKKYGTGIVHAPNITLGVNVMMLLTNIASSILNDYDFQITEVHHNKKKDSPSGTALKIAAEIEKGLAAAGNHSEIEEAAYNEGGAVPINSVRAGGVIGKHEVQIIGDEDMVTISHESFSRKAFASGAIRAASFIYRKSGFYEMRDVLNLERILENALKGKRKSVDIKPVAGSLQVLCK
ncbi:MAG: 4-hydroxy-tetrahydrodipicolinate reductase [Clostridiales bacterium]|nr:4-hydroxy-tetrahydrodipicolinate reductase [Clostridiales bacterium]